MIFSYTPQERATLEKFDTEAWDAQLKLFMLYQQIGSDASEFKDAKKKYLAEEAKRNALFTETMTAIEDTRMKRFGTADAILADAEQQTRDAILYIYIRSIILTATEKDKRYLINIAAGGLYLYPLDWDYEDQITAQKAAKFKPDESSVLLDAAGAETYILRDVLARHAAALKGKPEGTRLLELVRDIIDKSPYTVRQAPEKTDTELVTADSALFKANMPMYHGKATDALAALTGKGAEINTFSDKATIQTTTGDGVYKVVIQDFSKLKGNVGVNTHKLFSTAVAEFTQINNYGGGAINPKVTIPFDQYARKLGYEIDERPTATPEDAAKEKKRAAEAAKTAKKRIRQDLELLQAMRWTWTEKVKGETGDFDSISLLDRTAIKKGYIIMEFGRNMAEYLKRLPITQYPQGLLAIDARKANAYNMGLQMAIHFNMDNNQVRGTANRLKVSTLLSYTTLPTIEDLQNEKQDNSRQWYSRIKEPFEAALDELTGKVISSWEYVKTKGAPLTESEAYNIADYTTFAGLLVQFNLLDAEDHDDRLARRAEEKKRTAAKKAAARKRATVRKKTTNK